MHVLEVHQWTNIACMVIGVRTNKTCCIPLILVVYVSEDMIVEWHVLRHNQLDLLLLSSR